jgi:hypothetical protein
LHVLALKSRPDDEHGIAMVLGYNFYRKDDLKLNYRFPQNWAIVESREKDSNTLKNLYIALRKLLSDFKTPVVDNDYLTAIASILKINIASMLNAIVLLVL